MTPDAPGALDHLAALGRVQDDFLASIGEVDPETPVPWCGRWRVRHLVVHLGRIHHWAAAQAGKAREVPLGRGPFVLDEFYATHATEVRETLERLGDAEGWTLVGNGPASWWRRRQLHETLVHLWDLRASSQLPVTADPVLWGDTVDEVVTVMQPRQQAMGRMEPLPAPVRLEATDSGRTWSLGGVGEPAATVRAGSRDLALLVWGRRTPDEVTVAGDADALVDALARRLTP
ncbi:maleylpyruvate isomerase family mycothiol-dependent enzyme [Cellulomonas sp. DKR-3]|uniref:Maleylpyruvate isomerase family mycothiol-dependent enzyme n=1 Tax=Cellulomonas fulva TaxID=2835530 RepID=A0ABS5U0D1_9CELL|nr:maleylpyruvate isomerase family mycothiol-dependent enzyme [Cellulomonas fulva]MBT0994736.1 maleylpyruvate isomerase family mycothiol-dependent enzyme [Cellulomonas fulva]